MISALDVKNVPVRTQCFMIREARKRLIQSGESWGRALVLNENLADPMRRAGIYRALLDQLSLELAAMYVPVVEAL